SLSLSHARRFLSLFVYVYAYTPPTLFPCFLFLSKMLHQHEQTLKLLAEQEEKLKNTQQQEAGANQAAAAVSPQIPEVEVLNSNHVLLEMENLKKALEDETKVYQEKLEAMTKEHQGEVEKLTKELEDNKAAIVDTSFQDKAERFMKEKDDALAEQTS